MAGTTASPRAAYDCGVATATGSLRQKHADATRLRIRTAALELFAEHGFDGTTVEAIAERADVSARTLFRYFPTKEAVLFSAAEARFGEIPRLVAARPAEESPFEAFVAALHQATDDLASDPATRTVIRRLAPEVPYLRAQRVPLADDLDREVRVALASRAGIGPDDLALRAMVSAVSACVAVAMWAWIEDGVDGPFHAYLTEALDGCAAAFSGRRVRT